VRPDGEDLAAARSRIPIGLPGRTERRLWRLSVIALSAASLLGGAVAPILVDSPAQAATTSSLHARAATLARELRTAYLKLDVLDEAYDQAQLKVAGLRRAMWLENVLIARSKGWLARDTAHLRQVAIDAYVTGAASSGLTALLPGRAEMPEQQAYVSAASGSLHHSIATVALDRRRLGERRARLVASERTARAAARQIARDRAAAAHTTSMLEATLSQVKGSLVGLVTGRERTADAVAARHAPRAPPVPRPRTSPRRELARPHTSPRRELGGGSGAAAVRAAESQLGVPYVWGGATPGVGFDCSGLTMWAWSQAGVSLAHGATDQYYEIRHVSMSSLQPGDLIFYGDAGYLYHVVMYVGGGTVIQAEHTGTNVMFTPIPPGAYGAGQP
jgi:cell wall-associated NlpC family hydrolase